MQKSKKFLALLVFFLSISSVSTQSGCTYRNGKNTYKKTSSYLEFNINQILGYIFCYFALITNLSNESFFEDASKQKTTQIKKIAKDLGFSEQNIQNLRVKIPKKYSYFGKTFRNNHAAFSNTVIIGEQDNRRIAKTISDPGVKKFIYAHELSHIKYNHSLKSFLSFAISPIVTHYGIKIFNALYKSLLGKININGMSRTSKNIVTGLPGALDSLVPKYIIQLLLWTFIKKRFEKNADLGAAQLGPNVIRGGIKFLQTVCKMEQARKERVLSQYKGSTFQYIIGLYMLIKRVIYKIVDSHPSHETRIKYLQDALEKAKK